MTFPEFQRADFNSCSSNKIEDAETREEQQPGGRVLVLPQGIYITVFFSKWKMLTIDEAFFIPERRSQFDNLRNHRSSSEDHLRPD